MIKTVKVKKQLRLDELIKYIRDNRVREKTFRTDEHGNALSNALKVDEDGLIETYFPNMHLNNSFTVEVEEEIKADTLFEDIVILHINGISHLGRGAYHSIRSIRRDYPTVVEIHAVINGKLQLIWEAE